MGKKREIKSKLNSIDPKKKIIFSIILVLLPVVFFVLLEITLRAFHYGQDYRLFTEFNFYGKDYYKFNPEFGKKYFYKLPSMAPVNDLFLKEKQKNGYRIFVIGSSTTAGFPYTFGIAFPRILQARLQESYPDKQIEVINTGMTAINSYAFQDRIDEILDASADAVLIYGGHNEFYGGLGIASKESLGKFRFIKILHLELLDFKIYQLVRSVVFAVQQLFMSKKEAANMANATMMEKIATIKDIEYNSNNFKLAHKHYKANMESILKKCRGKGVPVFFSELISNIKDLPPLGSSQSKNYPPAIEVYQQGLDFEKAGDFEKAKTYLYRAKDLDCIRFRASEDLNSIINDLSKKYDATLIPMKRIFEAKSPNGLIGNNLITEHLHPNIDGYFLMADAFYSAMVNKKVIGTPDPHNIKSSEYYRKNWGFTELDSLTAEMRINKIKAGWPFTSESSANNYIAHYKPKNIADSIAYQAISANISQELAHKQLAKIYIARKAPEKAVQEYLANLRIEPYNIDNYIEAGRIFFQEGKDDKALELLFQALNIHRDIYLLSLIGETYSAAFDFAKAIPYFEEVVKLNPDYNKQKILKLLYRGYAAIGETSKTNEIYTKNTSLFSQGPIKNQTAMIPYTSPKTINMVNEAFQLLKEGHTEKGLNLLYEANKIQESSLAYRHMGEVLLQKKDKDALVYLEKIYYDYNTNAEYLNSLCYAYISFNDFDSAKKVLQELKQLFPNSANIPYFEKALTGM